MLVSHTDSPPACRSTETISLNFCLPVSFGLNVTVSPSTSVTCSVSVLSYEELPNLPPTACGDPSVSFSFTHVNATGGGGGADLEINWGYAVGRNLTGTRFVPDSEIVWTNTQDPTGTVQEYEGPAQFVITDLQEVAVS